MATYSLNKQNIFLPATNGETIVLSFTVNSGRIAYRDKINTIIGIKHPGIELGVDQFGYRWFVHHHYKNVKPSIEREDAFSMGVLIIYDNRPVLYNKYEIVERALNAWWFGNEYNWLWQNCQHFVSRVTNNKHESETLDRVADNLIGGGLLAGAAAAAGGKKELAQAALITAGIGGLIKLFSK